MRLPTNHLAILTIALFVVYLMIGETTQWRCSFDELDTKRQIRPIARQRPIRAVTVEIAVFYDQSFVDYHSPGGQDLRKVIRTVLRQSQINYLHYPTLNTTVWLAVTRIDAVPASQVNVSGVANQYLKNLCKWQREYHLFRGDYDLALFMTVRRMTSTPFPSASLSAGIAFPDNACPNEGDAAWNCALCRIRSVGEGGSIVAHEIGHTLGCRHDDFGYDLPRKCPVNGWPPAGLMNAFGGYKFNWSECSAAYISEYINTQEAACLRTDNARVRIWELWKESVYPSQWYTNDEQCAMTYGNGFQAYLGDRVDHHLDRHPACAALFCRKDLVVFSASVALEGSQCRIRSSGQWGKCWIGVCRSGRLPRP